VLDKSLLMEHFDELVCDPRLRRDQLLGWVSQLTGDQLYLDRYRVMLTSGSSGRSGLFVYDAAGWRSICAQILRTSSWAGLRPSVPRQRLALLGGAAPSHVSRQGAATMAIGLHRVLSLPVTLPLPQLVQALNQFQPTYLHVYPSVAMWLAEEQQAGRLRLAPQMLVTIAELRTPEMTRRLQEAFGVHPFDAYGCTEGLWAPSASTTRASTCSKTPPWSRTSTPTANRWRLASPAPGCWSPTSTTWSSRCSASR
jgi:phenylacetate-coenzyme A ligase PaaK-like adenylate-forming protein